MTNLFGSTGKDAPASWTPARMVATDRPSRLSRVVNTVSGFPVRQTARRRDAAACGLRRFDHSWHNGKVSNFAALKQRTEELTDLKSTLSVLTWDQETQMPESGTAFRARQLATLSQIYHRKLTDPEIGKLIADLEQQPLDLWQASSIRELKRDHEKALRLPESLVRELAQTRVLAYEEWVRARKNNDFAAFAPWLERMIRLKKEEARCYSSSGNPYEALLDEYEPGMQLQQLDATFANLRPRLSELLFKIQNSPRASNVPSLQGEYPEPIQQQLGREVLTAMGFDWRAGRLDTSPHPFCTGLNPRDVRITTRYSTKDFTSSFFGAVHEGGHALYEQGLNVDYFGLPACDSISLGIHESQSRLWENQVARSREFWVFWFPRLQKAFPHSLHGFSLDDLVRALNRVEASLIRVEADEVTYGLHIVMRYELEKKLITEDLAVQDLPEMWKDRMEEYLGIRPPTDSDGVLQDTHWSQGLIGYFPTYLLGNLYASQFFQQARQEISELPDRIARGELLPLGQWLREKIHRPGKTLSAAELVSRVTGAPLNPDHFLDYLYAKYAGLYEL